MRINKYLAGKGIASRREIDKLIEGKHIKINGVLAISGEKISDCDVVEIRGKKLELGDKGQNKVYFLLNKPLKVISASKDDRGRTTVVDLIETNERIFPIGRLDFETGGALILTNDGDLFNKIIHPRTEVYKDYLAQIRGFVEDKNIESLQDGIKLEDGVTLPAFVNIISRTQNKSILKISIREGKNRQIRRMFEAVGHRVEKLVREKIGKLGIENLKSGEYRELTKKEVEYLYSLGE
ncbi:MAG: pseudouridine synthase [Fusobacteriaceae bacterium]